MSLRFLFPCPNCDSNFELVTKQAGQTLTCQQCNQTCEAPKLGTLKQLETVGQAPAQSGRRSSGAGSWRNLLFVSGLGLAILAGVAGFFLYKHAQSRYTVFDIEDGIAMMESELDEVPPATVLKYYDVLNVDNGLGDWAEQPYVGENNQATILMNVSYGLFGLAGIGLILMIGGFLAPK